MDADKDDNDKPTGQDWIQTEAGLWTHARLGSSEVTKHVAELVKHSVRRDQAKGMRFVNFRFLLYKKSLV